YENVVGQDSLTRLDEKNKNKKKKRNRNNKEKSANNTAIANAAVTTAKKGNNLNKVRQDADKAQSANAEQKTPAANPANRNNRRRFKPKNNNKPKDRGNE
ncbi:MAG TPA: hypothetical protein VGE24_11715, partial [Emticicia sp.]